tara:strand:- start:32299 stop:32907 length:609 start_codon:yes stop_codon:yes gene_type:complete
MKRQDRRIQIRDCALSVFAAEGIAHANHTQIAKAAGVSLPTLFYHYPNHESLTAAVLQFVSKFLLEEIAQCAISEGPAGLPAIQRVLTRFAHSLGVHNDIVTVWLDWSTARASPVWGEYLKFHTSACDLIEPLIRQAQKAGDVDTELGSTEAAIIVVGAAHMITQMSLVGRPPEEIEKAIRRITIGVLMCPGKLLTNKLAPS